MVGTEPHSVSLPGWRSLVDSLLVVALGPTCVSCNGVVGTPTRGALCVECRESLARYASGPERLVEGTTAAPGRQFVVRAASDYDGPIVKALAAFKYQGYVTIGEPLAALMRHHAAAPLAHAHAVVPVPLHPWRRVSRGFNQAAVLARALGPPVWPILRRRTHTRPQARLSAEIRRTSVAGAFDLRRLWWPGQSLGTRRSTTEPGHENRLEGYVLIVVDDVCTTGSTLASCMSVLAARGAEVSGLTAALVASERPAPHPALRSQVRDDHRQ